MAKIKSITRRHYTGKVHDLTVKDLHAYNIEGLSVHNSAVGSLTLYVLGITQLDPIKYGLLFERFLNPDRVSPPDVDVDFEYTRRQEVVDYIIRKYGEDRCCKIGTYQKMKARSVVQNVVKALDLGKDWEAMEAMRKSNPFKAPESPKKSIELSNIMSKQIPEDENGVSPTIDESYSDCPEFRAHVDSNPGLLDIFRNMEKVIKSSGIHASGYIVSKNPVVDHVPMKIVVDSQTKNEVVCCQFEGPDVEELGLLKFDLLGLKNLTIVDKSLKMIKERYNKDIDIEHLEPNDKKVLALFNGAYRGIDNRGIFQFESYGISKLLKEINVSTFNDLAVGNALFRPGPLGAGIHTMYANFKNGRAPIEALHPKMLEVLKDTYGLMIFQESLMKISVELAGFTKGQSDTLRKIIGKKKPELIAKEQLDVKFIDGCKKNGISENIAREIFKQIEFFGGYGFNKSHSCAYAMQAYQNAYLKLYYPIEFMTNLLSINLDNEDKIDNYLKQALDMGIVVKLVDINKSDIEFTIEKAYSKNQNKEINVIRTPLTALKGVGDKAVESIIANRPFKTLKEFMTKVDTSKVNIKVFKALLDAGSMYCFADRSKYVGVSREEAAEMARNDIMAEYEILREEIEKAKNYEKNLERKLKKEQDKIEETFGGGSLFDKLGESVFTI